MPVAVVSLARRTVLARVLAAGMFVVAAAIAFQAGPAAAYDENSKSAINVDAQGVALRGYDPVSYFNAGTPTKGREDLTAVHEGARYQFASAANREAFMKSPGQYAPSFGGFCAMGAALGKKLDGDPTIWRVVDGKLYLNVHQAASTRWQEDIPGNLVKANNNWPTIRDKSPAEL
ncbi:YHS domain-containing protein [Constrictibacter sp. MBR-5]|jgi:YHS domain-containing protein|uniref:YHS domain-containing (seleno)protein n=1 Tax=Constrictibacter sp. MBR-5 TaxID=3156467 RepID=UPI00339A75C9